MGKKAKDKGCETSSFTVSGEPSKEVPQERGRATVVFRQLSSGEVVGEIITETGKVAISKNFGVMTEDEYKRILKLIELENPDIAWCDPIELTGN